jgi:hypothetical protein
MTMTGKAVWMCALVLAALAMGFSMRPQAHCHDGTCHAHVGGR